MSIDDLLICCYDIVIFRSTLSVVIFFCATMCMYLTVNAVLIAELWPRQLTDTCTCVTAIKGLHSLLGGDKLLVDTIYDEL